MKEFQNIMLEVWREACRHIGIDRSVERIAELLSRRMPIGQLAVFSFDISQKTLIPRAFKSADDTVWDMTSPRVLTADACAILREWLERSTVIAQRADENPCAAIRLLIGEPVFGDWLAGPLNGEHGATGALVLGARAGEKFETSHATMIESLGEPFAAILENDRRLHELNALREAAEADKRSALSRLGRGELLDKIIGGDGGLRAVLERAAMVARTDLPVLILGETGSGKEVIARVIHEQSPRAKGPFIRVNCGAIPSELIDSELFGHEQGAFTGATALRRGWFERADEGTLLLDEIGELSPAAQVRLLRVLQEGVFERVGGERPVRVNVRLIAATHRDLPAMAQNGRFREDLWYRIAGFPILLPPLRERQQDIPALAAHFAKRAAHRFGLRPQTPAVEDLALLARYEWPGNVRELASVMDRAAILGDGRRLAVAQALGAAPAPGSESAPRFHAAPPTAAAECATLDQAMRRHIEAALTAARGKIEGDRGAAKLLDINPHTLRARMRKLGIHWAQYRQ